jgi:lambda repressor-like predicted transcriptional regulator
MTLAERLRLHGIPLRILRCRRGISCTKTLDVLKQKCPRLLQVIAWMMRIIIVPRPWRSRKTYEYPLQKTVGTESQQCKDHGRASETDVAW